MKGVVEAPREEHDLPTVSVVMPIRNESGFIAQSLGAVLAQSYPAELLEIVVVDGLSDDGTRQTVRDLAASRDRADVRLVDNPRRIAATALNVGLGEARGEVIVRVDGHCVIAPDYVERVVDSLRENPAAGCVGGPIDTVGTSRRSRAIAVAMSSSFGVGGSAFRTGSDRRLSVDTVAFPGFRRQALEAAGPFDEQLVRNQDDEYSYRLRRLGFEILLVPEIRSEYYSRARFATLWRQYFEYGFWKVRVLQKHPRQMKLRQFVPPAFVATVAASLAAAWWTAVPLVLVLAAYLAANLAASLWTAASRGWQHLIWLPSAFATLHLAYGSGFLVGLARFASLWWRQAGGASSDHSEEG